jgi:uncharacterized protein YecE (DUF72 family)
MPQRRDDGPLLFDLGDREPARPEVRISAHVAALAPLAARMPTGVRLGTSSWTFPTWDGLVYDRVCSESELVKHGLPAYSAHPLFNAVGLDRTYYRPMSESQFRELATGVPDSFRFLVKAHGELTRPPPGGRSSARSAVSTGLFLDLAWARDQVWGPAAAGLGEKLGVVLLQFPPMALAPRNQNDAARAFIDQLASFLAGLPADVPTAVEVRNRELFESELAPRYLAALAEAGVDHCYSGHPSMPSIGKQLRLVPIAPRNPRQTPVTCRWLLHPAHGYDEARERYFPFKSLVEEDDGSRAEIARLALAAVDAGRSVIVIINNKAEGSAPLSVERLAERIAAPRQD